MKITDIANVQEDIVMLTPSGYPVVWKGSLLNYVDNYVDGGIYELDRKDITGTWRLESEPREKTVTITKSELVNAVADALYESNSALSDFSKLLSKRLGLE